MKKLILLLAALLAAPAAFAQGAAPERYVVRHLHTPAGEADPDLLAEGKTAAQALAKWFAGKKLSAIYVSDFKRARQTAGPLAEERGIVPTLYDHRDTPALIARVAAAKGPVLIVGHSNTVPDIVAGLGGDRPAPMVHEDFGDVWTIANGKTVREKLPGGHHH